MSLYMHRRQTALKLQQNLIDPVCEEEEDCSQMLHQGGWVIYIALP